MEGNGIPYHMRNNRNQRIVHKSFLASKCDPSEYKDDKSFHGAVCVGIITSICSDIELWDLNVTDSAGTTQITVLLEALEWCIQNKIKLIHMSLGTINYFDIKPLWIQIKRLLDADAIIVAAYHNRNIKTYQGATICINDSLLHMVRNMSIFKPDIMLMVPMMIETIYKRLSAADPQIPKVVLAEKVFGGKLQTIFTGGAHLDPYYIDRFAEYGVQILEGYGMSECSPVISNNTPENHKPGSIGRPLENVEIRFENGEILVKGTSVMKGYYQMPDETAETLKDGWLHTGDKGYMDEDGYLFINGRVKNLIILSNGENISPEEIENKLALNPLVGEVIVTGEDNGLTARIYPEQAVVEAKALDTEMIRSQLQEFLDEYNKNQPTYRRITGLVIRKNPFIRSTTKKIRRQDVLIDEPQA